MKVFYRSPMGNTPIKEASAFYFNVKSHVCYKKASISHALTIAFLQSSSTPSLSNTTRAAMEVLKENIDLSV